MKIAPHNFNGIEGRPPPLLAWLEETRPDDHLLPGPELAPRLVDAGVNKLWVQLR